MSKINKVPQRGFYIRQAIKDTLVEFNVHTDISKITISEICKNVPIARTTFYYYYQDLHEVLDEIEDDLIAGFYTVYKEYLITDFSQYKPGDNLPILEDTLFYIKLNMKYFKALLGPHPDYGFIERWKKIIRDAFKEKWVKEGIEYKNMDLVLHMLASSAVEAYTYWVNNEDKVDFLEISKEIGNRLFYEEFLISEKNNY